MDASEKFPSQLAERFQIRLPDGMRDRLKAEAEANKRSMNAEIVARLESSFTPTLYVDEEMRPVMIGQLQAAKAEWEGMAGGIQTMIRELADVASTRQIVVEAAAKIMKERVAAGAPTADLVKAVEEAVASLSTDERDHEDR